MYDDDYESLRNSELLPATMDGKSREEFSPIFGIPNIYNTVFHYLKEKN
jgi:hypothetical protein